MSFEYKYGISAEALTMAQETEGKVPFACFWVWTFVLIGRPQDYLNLLVHLRPVVLITAITLISMVLSGIKPPTGIKRNQEVRLLFIFYLIMLVGIPFAVHRGVAFHFVFSIFPMTLLYFLVFLVLVNSEKKLKHVASAAVAGAVLHAFYYMKGTAFTGNIGYRVDASLMYDPNDIAFVFATFLPLTLYFFLVKGSFGKKSFFFISVISMAAGIIITQSRGGILALAVIIAALMFLKTDLWRGWRKRFAVILLVITASYYFPLATERFQNLDSDYNVSDEGGRLSIWKQNLLILGQNPIFGVGANCSMIALGQYRAQNQDGLQAWQVTHSSVIQVAVETGVPGFIVYAVLNLGAIVNFRRMRKKLSPEQSLFPFFLEISFYGFWGSALFLTYGYSIHLWFLMAMSASMRLLNDSNGIYSRHSTSGETF